MKREVNFSYEEDDVITLVRSVRALLMREGISIMEFGIEPDKLCGIR